METQKNVRKKVPSEPILEDELESAKIKKGNYIAREVPGDVVTAPACGASSRILAVCVWESKAAGQESPWPGGRAP